MGALVTISLNHLCNSYQKKEFEEVFTFLKPAFPPFFSYNNFSVCDKNHMLELFSADVILTFYQA